MFSFDRIAWKNADSTYIHTWRTLANFSSAASLSLFFFRDYLEKFFAEQELQLTNAYEQQNNSSIVPSITPHIGGEQYVSKRRLSSELFLKPLPTMKRTKPLINSNDDESAVDSNGNHQSIRDSSPLSNKKSPEDIQWKSSQSIVYLLLSLSLFVYVLLYDRIWIWWPQTRKKINWTMTRISFQVRSSSFERSSLYSIHLKRWWWWWYWFMQDNHDHFLLAACSCISNKFLVLNCSIEEREGERERGRLKTKKKKKEADHDGWVNRMWKTIIVYWIWRRNNLQIWLKIPLLSSDLVKEKE